MLNFLRTSVLLAVLTAIFMAVGYFVGGTLNVLMESGFTSIPNNRLRGLNGELFPGVTKKTALAAFKAAQQASGLVSGHVLHDLRHTYAVNALKRGLRAEVVARQLGHRDSSMVNRVYGRYLPDASDYDVPATSGATSNRKQVKR